MISIPEIVARQSQWVVAWHQNPLEQHNPEVIAATGFLHDVGQQHQYNFLLWHEEDRARDPLANDASIAQVKRAIDRYNQLRNDWIERLDDRIANLLAQASVKPAANLRLATETPGSAIDRLSIMSLRLYHLEEQLQRPEISLSQQQLVEQKVQRCREQQRDLISAAQALIHDIFVGQVKHRTYQQHKMYNDPALNPYLYQQRTVISAERLKLDDAACEGAYRRAA